MHIYHGRLLWVAIHYWCNNRDFCSNMFILYVSVRHEMELHPNLGSNRVAKAESNIKWWYTHKQVQFTAVVAPDHKYKVCKLHLVFLSFCIFLFFFLRVSIKTLGSAHLTLGLLFPSWKGAVFVCLTHHKVLWWFHFLQNRARKNRARQNKTKWDRILQMHHKNAKLKIFTTALDMLKSPHAHIEQNATLAKICRQREATHFELRQQCFKAYFIWI